MIFMTISMNICKNCLVPKIAVGKFVKLAIDQFFLGSPTNTIKGGGLLQKTVYHHPSVPHFQILSSAAFFEGLHKLAKQASQEQYERCQSPSEGALLGSKWREDFRWSFYSEEEHFENKSFGAPKKVRWLVVLF